MKEKWSSLVSVVTAFITAGCCLGPLILIPLGLSGFAGTLAIFATKYQGILVAVTLGFLAFSFYLVYGRGCRKRSTVITLWVSTFFVISMLTYTAIVKD